MATARVEVPQNNVVTIPQTSQVVPIKVAWFGEQGTGKTTSAALTAAALSKEIHGGAPVWVTDPELGWKFAKRRIFDVEKIELVQRTTPTFKAMMDDIRAAERSGACVWAVELGKIWMELLKTVQSRCGDRWGQELVKMWNDYIAMFLNSNMHCMGLGRVSDVTDEVLNDDGRIQRVKVAEAMKAGGRNNFGYEPDLVIRMSLEIKPRRRNGQVHEAEGRMNHRAYILKDRTWELNGKMFTWSDRSGYKAGDYRYVWQSLRPHFLEVQATSNVKLDMLANSDDMISRDGQSSFTQRRQQQEIWTEEIKNSLSCVWSAATGKDATVKIEVINALFGTHSWTAVEKMDPEILKEGASVCVRMKNLALHHLPVDRNELLDLVKKAQDEIEDEKVNPPEGKVPGDLLGAMGAASNDIPF